MPTSVRCYICLNKELELAESDPEAESRQSHIVTETPYLIRSNIIAKNDQEAMQLLATELLTHMQANHSKELQNIVTNAAIWNGFNLMKYFETKDEDSQFEKEKEIMRDQLIEEVMYMAPEDEGDDDDDEYENDLTEDDDDENSTEVLEVQAV